MKLELRRMTCGSKCTIGRLTINGSYECEVLEDVDRGLETNPAGKVPGETCIPRGTYQIIIDYSNRFKRELPRLLDVPGFEGIRIHSGNSAVDTEGCLLPGFRDDMNSERVVMSRIAFDGIFKRMQEAYDRNEEIWIEIS